MEWTPTTHGQAADIAKLTVKTFGTEGLFADIGTGPDLVIAKALQKQGVKGITAWDLEETINKVPIHYPAGIEVVAHDATTTYQRKIDVVLIPFVFSAYGLLLPTITAQDPVRGGVVYRTTSSYESEFRQALDPRYKKYEITEQITNGSPNIVFKTKSWLDVEK